MKKYYNFLKPFFILSALLLGSFGVKAQMSGSYIVGPSLASDFNTIQLACDSLKAQGVSGPVVLNIESGAHTEFTIDSVAGLSATNTVTFQSQALDSSLVIISTTTPINLNIDHVVLNQLTFTQVGSSNIIEAISKENLTVTSCTFNNTTGGYAIDINNPITSLGSYATNITIDKASFVGVSGMNIGVENTSFITLTNSTFNNTSVGAYIYGDFGTSNVTVNNCLMKGANSGPLYVESSAGDIKNIDIQNTILKGRSYGVYVYTDKKIKNVNVNNVDFIGTNSGSPYAFYIENDIRDIDNITINNITADSAYYGVYVYSQYDVSDVSIMNANIDASYTGFYVESERKLTNVDVYNATFDSVSRYVGYLYSYHEMDNISIKKSSGTSSSRDGLYIYSDRNITNVTMDSVEFNGDYTSTSDEGLYIGSDQSIIGINITNAIFKGGRGMYVYAQTDLSIVNIKNVLGYGKYNTFSSNSGYGVGLEAYYGVLSSLVIDSSQFFSDTGTAMSIDCNDASFDWVVIKNTDIKTKGSYALEVNSYAGGKNLQIGNCDIEATKAYGYGVYVYNNYVSLEDVVVSGNTINSTQYGVYIESYYNNGMKRGLIESNDIIIDSVNTSGGRGIYLYSDTKVDDYQIKGNNINCAKATSGYGVYAGGYTSGTSGLTVEGNNMILSGTSTEGIYVEYLKNNNTIAHNVIDVDGSEYIDNGIYLDGDYHTTNDLIVEGNVISNAEESIYGDEIRDFKILNNTFKNETSNGGDAIDINDVDGGNFVIAGNICYSFEGSGNSLELDDVILDSNNKGIVINNFFGNLAYGASLDNVSNLLLANNTFTTGSSFYNVLAVENLCENIEIYNNIFQVDPTNFTADLIEVEYPNQIKGMNYNVTNIDTATSNYVYDSYYGNYYKDITDWSAYSGFDTNSFYENVVFVNDTLDLHILCFNTSLMAGMPLSEVAVDVDGHVRGGTPFIGADEILSSGDDIFAQTSIDARQYTQYVLDAGASSGSVTYNWNTGATTQTIIVDTTGTYTVTITDGCGSYTDSVYVQVGGYASLDENELLSFNVYPNPSNGMINIVVDESIVDNYEVRLLSTSGQIIKRLSGNNKGQLTIDFSNQANGLYLIQVVSDLGNSTRRIIKN